MILSRLLTCCTLVCGSLALRIPQTFSRPQLTIYNDGTTGNVSALIQNDKFSMQLDQTFGTKLMYRGIDLVGNASGLYASHDGQTNLTYTSVSLFHSTATSIDVLLKAQEGDLHLVLYTGLPGWYSYFVNKGFGLEGEFRTLIRLDGLKFPNGRTAIKNGPLPLFVDILNSVKVQDETWQRPNGSYITKYNWSAFLREQDFWGVYGDESQSGVGVWQINPGGYDYYNGDQNKQELMLHRESLTGDAVLLNMLHGTHFQANATNVIPYNKTFGPWLMYINDGSPQSMLADAKIRQESEEAKWPYEWMLHSVDHHYHARAIVQGRLVLSDGRPAAGAAIFLGDPKGQKSINEGSNYYYTGYADANGSFKLTNVRTGLDYQLQAWANGGLIGDVTTVYKSDTIHGIVNKSTRDLGTLTWNPSPRQAIFQIGDADRKSSGFQYGDSGYECGVVERCPVNLDYTIGVNQTSDWCFGQSVGTAPFGSGLWSIHFHANEMKVNTGHNATLILSLAGYSGGTTTIGISKQPLVVSVNNRNVTQDTGVQYNDPSLYRSSTVAGEWRYMEFFVSNDHLVAGMNSIQLTMTNATKWHGLMWDYVKMEWNE